MIAIGMTCMVIGMLGFCGAWVARNMKLVGSFGLIMVGGIFFGIGGSASKGKPHGDGGMVSLGIIFIAIGVVLLVLSIKQTKKAVEIETIAKLERIGGTPLDRFFVECVLAEYNDFSVKKNVEKAKLLAEKYGLNYAKGIEALYEEALTEHETISEKLVESRHISLREAEKSLYDELNKYANLYGKDKRVAMLTDTMKALRKKADDLDKYASLNLRSTQQKEHDWAIHGGIASGIAGPLAGAVTAVNIQAKNAQIRAENQARMQAAMPSYMFATSTASGNRENAKKIQKEIDEVQMKLISDVSAAELLRYIKFENTEVRVSELGTCTVETVATLESSFKIYGDVDAVVDGTIVAKIYDKSTFIGTAQMVLPLYGVGQNINLTGMCLECGKPGKEYRVEFAASKLWAIER